MTLLGTVGNKNDADLIAGNIKDGVEVFGKVGTFASAGGTFSGSTRKALILNEIRYVSDFTETPYQYCGMYENETYAWYFWEHDSLQYNSGGSANVRAIKVNKATGATTTVSSGGIYATTSGGTHIPTGLSVNENGGVIGFLSGDDGIMTYDTATDTFTPWNYGWNSNNKSFPGTNIIPNKYTVVNGQTVWVNTIFYATSGAVNIQTVFEIQ